MKRFYRGLSMLLALAAATLGGAAGVAEEALPQLDAAFTARDLSGEWDATAAEILLTGETAETRVNGVSVEGGTVTILDDGTYVLSGTLDDGEIIVDVGDDEKVQLVLNGVSVANADGPAIRVLQADKVFITLAEGTENALSSAAFAEAGVEAVVYSDEDLTFNGTGTLVIDSPAGDGIDGKDDVKFASGAYVITAAGKGVDANDSLRIAGGDFTLVTDGTALRASHSDDAELGNITVWGGAFSITTGGGAGEMQVQEEMGPGMGGFGPPSAEDGNMPTPPDFQNEGGDMPTPPEFNGENGDMPTPPEGGMAGGFPGGAEVQAESDEDGVASKGLKASGDIVILGGTFSLDCADDAFHADGDLTVFDGGITLKTGDDGLHADGTLAIEGGAIDIAQSNEGLEGKVIRVSGGDIALVAADDGLNAADSAAQKESFAAQEGVAIEISGGTLYVNAAGDGIDSNGDLTVTGGATVVSGPTNSMNGALDYNGAATIRGGTVVAAGASVMAEGFSDTAGQAAALVRLSGSAGEITVSDAEGHVILSATVEKDFQTVVVSCPELVAGGTYTVACGDASAEFTVDNP